MSKGLWSQFSISPGQHSLQTPPFDSTTSESPPSGAFSVSLMDNGRFPAQPAVQVAFQHFSISGFQALGRVARAGQGRVLGRRHNCIECIGLALSAALLRLCLPDPFSPCGNTENENPLLCDGLSNLMTKGSIQSWKLLLFFSGGIQSRTGWRFGSK